MQREGEPRKVEPSELEPRRRRLAGAEERLSGSPDRAGAVGWLSSALRVAFESV